MLRAAILSVSSTDRFGVMARRARTSERDFRVGNYAVNSIRRSSRLAGCERGQMTRDAEWSRTQPSRAERCRGGGGGSDLVRDKSFVNLVRCVDYTPSRVWQARVHESTSPPKHQSPATFLQFLISLTFSVSRGLTVLTAVVTRFSASRKLKKKKNFIYHKLIRQIIRHIAKISMEGPPESQSHRSRPPIVNTHRNTNSCSNRQNNTYTQKILKKKKQGSCSTLSRVNNNNNNNNNNNAMGAQIMFS